LSHWQRLSHGWVLSRGQWLSHRQRLSHGLGLSPLGRIPRRTWLGHRAKRPVPAAPRTLTKDAERGVPSSDEDGLRESDVLAPPRYRGAEPQDHHTWPEDALEARECRSLASTHAPEPAGHGHRKRVRLRGNHQASRCLQHPPPRGVTVVFTPTLRRRREALSGTGRPRRMLQMCNERTAGAHRAPQRVGRDPSSAVGHSRCQDTGGELEPASAASPSVAVRLRPSSFVFVHLRPSSSQAGFMPSFDSSRDVTNKE
jgi:hypothetical protein